jgi:c-di-GMP-binding flagellar brake protein YcgR
VVASDAQLQSLMAKQPLREAAWPGTDGAAAVADAGNESDTADQSKQDDVPLAEGDGRLTFHDMRLRVGSRIQLQLPASLGADRHIVRLLGYLDNASLMVTAPMSNGLRVPVQEHDNIVARVFASQKAFGFDCSVVRVCKLPYHYLHLSWPEKIQGAVVRKSPRIRTKIIASVSKPEAGEHGEKQSGVIIDLSADGALIKARQQLAEKSQTVVLSFRVNIHNMEALLTTKAVVRNIFTDEEKEGADPLKYHHGVQFLDLQANDRVILQSLIYQQMIEQPNTVT